MARTRSSVAAAHARRQAYTILELMVVLTIVLILGAVLIPTLAGYYGNTRQKAAADLIRSRVVEARAKAMEQGAWYRLAVNQDKTRIRLAPDNGLGGQDFSSLTAPVGTAGPDAKVVEDVLDNASAELILDQGDTRTPDGEWLTVLTIGPEGICKENNTIISVKEADFQPLLIQIRGIVGSAAIVAPPKNWNKK